MQPSFTQEGILPQIWNIHESAMSHHEPRLDNLFPSLLQVLIIGGGDGGVLREVVKNALVESVVLCEIDEVGATTTDEDCSFSLLRAVLIIVCCTRCISDWPAHLSVDVVCCVGRH